MKKPYIKVLIGVAAILLAVIIAVIALWPNDTGNSGAVGTLWNPTTTASRVPNGTTARPAVTTTATTATTTAPTVATTAAPSTTTTTTTAITTTTTTTAPTTAAPTTPSTSAPIGGSVTLPTQVDPDTGKNVVSFPCTVEPYGLVIERMAPYTGKYVEDGTNTSATDVAMLLVHNQSGHPIEFASLTVEFEGVTLLFDISALPAGSKAVVQEKMRRAIPADQEPAACKALVVQRAEQGFAADQVSVTENEDGSLTVTNLTDETIPAIRVFYKYYLSDEDIYVGGIAFSAKVTQLRPHSSITIRPTHYEKGSSRIVMVAAYEEDAG